MIDVINTLFRVGRKRGVALGVLLLSVMKFHASKPQTHIFKNIRKFLEHQCYDVVSFGSHFWVHFRTR